MTETVIQTARMEDGSLAWNTDQRSCLSFPVGKQRARVLLGADLLSAYVDGTLAAMFDELSTALQGWERSRKQIVSDRSLTDKERKLKDADIDREIGRLQKEIEQLEAFDPDRYLYEVAKVAVLDEVEFGQLTNLLKKHITDRRGRPCSEELRKNWRALGESTALVMVQTSSRSEDLLGAVHGVGGSPVIGKAALVEGRIVPFTWLVDWLLGEDAIGLELGRSELRAAKALSSLERDMDPKLRSLHREVIRRACCIRGLIDSIELVHGSRNGPVRLRLRGDFIASFLPAFADYRSLSERFDRIRQMDTAGLVVVGMSGSGKTTFLRRCYDLLREDVDNLELSEEIDPKSTAFVVGHVFRDITVPFFDERKRITLCWMDTAGSEDYRLLGQQLMVSVRELGKGLFSGRPADYNLLFMWSYEPGYDPNRDDQGFEDVLSRFIDEVEDLGYFDLDLPGKIFLLLNKVDVAAIDGAVDRFCSEHERRFRSVMDRKNMTGESLGFFSSLNSDAKEISDRFLVTVFGLSERDWKRAFTSIRAGINQGVIGNLLGRVDAARFKQEVYDRYSGSGQETYLRETVAWIDRYLDGAENGNASTRAMLRSLRSFLSGEMESDAVA